MAEGFRLVMSQGPQPGQTYMLDRDVMTMGRDPASSIVLSEPKVSRQHARIVRRGGLLVLEDLGSTNGTFANGMRLTGPHTLSNGDVVGLADAVSFTYYGMAVSTESMGGQAPAGGPPPYVPQVAPAYAPPPAPAYGPPAADAYPSYGAGPAEPAYGQAPEEERPKKRRQWLFIGCGCLALIVACVAVVVFLYYAPAGFWQFLIDLGIPIPSNPF